MAQRDDDEDLRRPVPTSASATAPSPSIGSAAPTPSVPAGSFNFLQYVTDGPPEYLGHKPQASTGPVWVDNAGLSETHYHHGDHHHYHYQRHVHHFHDIHLLGSAEEVLDLRATPSVQTHVIPSENPLPQLRLRPDLVGKMAFDAGAEQFFGSLSSRFDQLTADSGSSSGTH